VEAYVEDFMLLPVHFSFFVVTDAKAATNFDADAFAVGLTSFIELTLVIPVSVSRILSPSYETSILVFVSIHRWSGERRQAHSLEGSLERRHVQSIFFKLLL
jgi:hypothetical protein